MGINGVLTGSAQKSGDTVPINLPVKSVNSADPSTKDSVSAASANLAVSNEALQKAVEKTNKILAGSPIRIEYMLHKNSSFIAIKVINSETNEVIKEIPTEKFFELKDKLPEISGTIFDKKS